MTRSCRLICLLTVTAALVGMGAQAARAAEPNKVSVPPLKSTELTNSGSPDNLESTLIVGGMDAPAALPPVNFVPQEDLPTPHVGCATPTVIYQNTVTDAGGFFIPLGGFASDDVTLTGTQRLLCSYQIAVRSTSGSPFQVDVELFTACPTPIGAGVAIPGTAATFLNVPVSATPQVLTVTLSPPVVITQNTIHIKVTDPATNPNNNGAGAAFTWRLTGAAETGTTADLFGLFNPSNTAQQACNFFFNSAPIAGFFVLMNADVGPGACCTASGNCVSGPSGTECVAAGGVYNGDGSDCANVVCSGACCQVGTCTQETGPNCLNLNGVFKGLGVDCAGANCVAECATDAGRCHTRDNVNGRTSNRTTFNSAEDFIPAAGSTSVNQVCVWGSYAASLPLPVSSFRVRYFTSVNGLPGALLATFTEGTDLTVTGPAPTGSALGGGAEVYNWNLSHAPVAVTPGECHWVEVTNSTTSNWFWATSADGNSYWMQDGTPATAYDSTSVVATAGINLAYCLNNATNNFVIDNANQDQCVSGACILSVCPFTCLNGVTAAGCAAAALAATGNAANGSFVAAQTCIQTNAQPVACCRGDMDGNGAYNGRDIQAFAHAIRDWVASTDCQANDIQFCRANMNEDFILSAADVPGFVTIILNSGETNDRCCGAPSVALTAGVTSVISMNNTNATTTLDDVGFSCNTPANSRGFGGVYVKFVAPAVSIFVTTEGSVAPATDSLVQVLQGQCGGFVSLGCDDNTGTGNLSSICVSGLNIGDTYYIALASFTAATQGNYTVNLTSPCPVGKCCSSAGCAVGSQASCEALLGVYAGDGTDCTVPCPVPPANDVCAGAVTVTCGGGPVSMDNTNATTDVANDPAFICYGGATNSTNQGRASVWAKFQATAATATVTVGGSGAANDSVLQVFDGLGCNPPGTRLGCNEDISGTNFLSTVALTGLTPGNSYLIEVAAFTNAEKGPYTVTVTCP